MSQVLCQLTDIEDGGSAALIATVNGRPHSLIAVRRGADVRLYINSCPHIGSPLDFEPGKFLDASGEMIQCSTHGAKFRIDDGHCVSGPCEGQNLEAVACEVRDGQIFIVSS